MVYISVHYLRSQISQEPAQHLQGEADDPARLEGFHRGDCLDDQEFHLCDDNIKIMMRMIRIMLIFFNVMMIVMIIRMRKSSSGKF